jgi:hypothetical protein
MFSIAILIVLSGAAMSALLAYQKIYKSLDLKTDVLAGLRGATELMSQEIGQAGLLNYPGTSLAAPVAASLSPQAATLNSTAGIFVGEKLLVDAGTAQEAITVSGVGSTTVAGIFQKSHDAGAPVNAVGVFPQGVLSSSTATQLQLLGDVNGDGTLVYVQYDCDLMAGTLSRSITPIAAVSAGPPQILLTGLLANPNGAPCFQYRTAAAAGYTFVTNVGMTVTIQSPRVDPQTGEFVILANTYSSFSPRNVWAGLEMAQAGIYGSLQPIPPGVPLQ